MEMRSDTPWCYKDEDCLLAGPGFRCEDEFCVKPQNKLILITEEMLFSVQLVTSMVRDEAKYKTFTKPNLLYTTLTAAHIRLLGVRTLQTFLIYH